MPIMLHSAQLVRLPFVVGESCASISNSSPTDLRRRRRVWYAGGRCGRRAVREQAAVGVQRLRRRRAAQRRRLAARGVAVAAVVDAVGVVTRTIAPPVWPPAVRGPPTGRPGPLPFPCPLYPSPSFHRIDPEPRTKLPRTRSLHLLCWCARLATRFVFYKSRLGNASLGPAALSGAAPSPAPSPRGRRASRGALAAAAAPSR